MKYSWLFAAALSVAANLNLNAIEPFSVLNIEGKDFCLVSDLSEIESFDEVVFAAYPSNFNGVCCMSSLNYAGLEKYRDSSCSPDGKVWDTVNDIEVLTVDRRRDNLFAFLSDGGYLAGGGDIGFRDKDISENSLWELDLLDNECIISCLKNNNSICFYDIKDMFVFSNHSDSRNAPCRIYRHSPADKCGKPVFDIPQARYPKAISVTVSSSDDSQTISFSVYKNDRFEPWLTGGSNNGSCVIDLPEDDIFADTKYTIHARAHIDGRSDCECIATYYVCTKKFLAFTKVKDFSEIADDDLVIFVCPELHSAMASDRFKDSFGNRFGTPVNISDDRVDIVNPEVSDVAFFFVNTSGSDENAVTFNDYSYRSVGNNGFLAENRNQWHVLATVSCLDLPNFTTDWLVKIDNGMTLVTPNTDPRFEKSIIGADYSNGRTIYQLHERKSMQQLQLKYVDIYHSDKLLSSVNTSEVPFPMTKILLADGGIRIRCQGSAIIRIYSVMGRLVKARNCCDNDIIPLSPGFYIATTNRGEAVKIFVK